MTTATLTRQRCWVHLEREAAARCPVCTHFYCRECVTEHEGRVICAACLRGLLAATAARRSRLGAGSRRALAVSSRGVQVLFSVAAAWFFFHLLGQWLLTTTAQFHEAALWKEQLFGGSSGINDDDGQNDKPADKDGDGGKDSSASKGEDK